GSHSSRNSHSVIDGYECRIHDTRTRPPLTAARISSRARPILEPGLSALDRFRFVGRLPSRTRFGNPQRAGFHGCSGPKRRAAKPEARGLGPGGRRLEGELHRRRPPGRTGGRRRKRGARDTEKSGRERGAAVGAGRGRPIVIAAAILLFGAGGVHLSLNGRWLPLAGLLDPARTQI